MAHEGKGKYQGKMGWLNGKWVTLRIKDKTKLSVGWSKWEETKEADWACYICDPYVDDVTDFYLGNYASDENRSQSGKLFAKRNHPHVEHTVLKRNFFKTHT